MKNNSCDICNHFYISDKYSSDDWDRMEDPHSRNTNDYIMRTTKDFINTHNVAAPTIRAVEATEEHKLRWSTTTTIIAAGTVVSAITLLLYLL